MFPKHPDRELAYGRQPGSGVMPERIIPIAKTYYWYEVPLDGKKVIVKLKQNSEFRIGEFCDSTCCVHFVDGGYEEWGQETIDSWAPGW